MADSSNTPDLHAFSLGMEDGAFWLTVECPYDRSDEARPCWPHDEASESTAVLAFGWYESMAEVALAAADRVVPLPPEPLSKNLIVEFVVPHYFASLFASQYPDEHGGFGATVFFRNEEDDPEEINGDVTIQPNHLGEWILEVSDERGFLFATHIDNIERIVVM